MGKVIITVGPPGVGKSYWIKEYIEKHKIPYVICSADQYFETENGKTVFIGNKLWLAHKQCFEKFVNALRNEIPLIIIDNCNARNKDRAIYVNKALEYDYEVELKVFPIDVERIKLQNKSPERLEKDKAVKEDYIDRVIKRIDIEPGMYKLIDRKPVKILETNQFIRSSSIS